MSSGMDSNSSVSGPAVESAKLMVDLLLELCKCTLSTTEVHKLRTERYWPCRPSKDAPLIVVGGMDVFFISDHPHLLEVFDHDIPVLYLTPLQFRKLEEIFRTLGFAERLLSRNVTEITSATDMSSLDVDLSQDLQNRQQALF
jgi:hypothetical protein